MRGGTANSAHGAAGMSPWKKGVGYSETYANVQNDDDYCHKKRQQEQEHIIVFKLLFQLLRMGRVTEPKSAPCSDSISLEFATVLMESPLLSVLSRLLSNDSLTDMALSFELYQTACLLVQALCGFRLLQSTVHSPTFLL